MTMNQKQLLLYLSQVSFALYDTALFLDTHPECQQALAYYDEMKQERKQALDLYTHKFAPLHIDNVDTDCGWTWGRTPLPWEN